MIDMYNNINVTYSACKQLKNRVPTVAEMNYDAFSVATDKRYSPLRLAD